MKIKSEISQSPELRFPSYQEEWDHLKIGEFVKKISVKNKENKEYPIYSINNNTGFVPQGEQFEGLDSSERGYDISMYKIISENTFAYNPARINVGSIGYSGLLNNVIISSLYVCFKTSKNIDDEYLLVYLKSDKFLKQVKRHVEGGVRDYLFFENFSSIKTNIPKIEEQKRIADFHSKINRLIDKLSEKIELLEHYKSGVLQKIFTAEIQFNDNSGNPFRKWETRKVGDFLVESRIKGSSGLTAKKITVKLWGKGVVEKDEKNEGSAQTQYFKRKSGQFIYSKLDFLNCAFGIIPPELDGFESTVDLPSFDVSKNLNIKFLLERVKMKDFYKKYGDTADGSRKAKRIHSQTFLSFPIEYPCLEEQNKIADFLTLIDEKIRLSKVKMEQVENWKKGLLEKMFIK